MVDDTCSHLAFLLREDEQEFLFKVSKISLRSTLWPIDFDMMLMIIIMIIIRMMNMMVVLMMMILMMILLMIMIIIADCEVVLERK